MKIKLLAIVSMLSVMTGCAHYNAHPYTALADNQILIKQAAAASETKDVAVESVTLRDGLKPDLNCRAAGPINPAPGKTPEQYIEEALKTELYMGGIYLPESANKIRAQLTDLSFSSVASANWTMGLHLSSNSMPKGYEVKIEYPFSSSFIADFACKNVAEAFAPAVQTLVKKAVSSPEFKELIKN